MNRINTSRAYAIQDDDAPGFWQAGNLWRVMASGVQTDNQFCLLDQICTDKGGGPPTHTHAQDEGLYVVSGHCTFHAGGADIEAGAGTFVAVPRLTPHAFNVDAPDTQLLNFYLPAGFELILMGVAHPAERNTVPPPDVALPPRQLVEQLSRDYGQVKVLGLPFADAPTPENMKTAANPDAVAQPFAASMADAPAYWHAGGLFALLATGERTAGSYSMFEQLMPRGPAAASHVHRDMDEIFYVLEGDVTFLLDDRIAPVRKGGMTFVPRGTVHGFRIDSEVARVLNIYTPAGFEKVVTMLGEPTAARTLPPTGWTPPVVSSERRTELFDSLGIVALAVSDPFAPDATR